MDSNIPEYEVKDSALNCFHESTEILTDQGYRLIESLRVGDRVVTVRDGPRAIHSIGRKFIHHPMVKNRIRDQLYCYKQSEYPGLSNDLILTGGHSVLVPKLGFYSWMKSVFLLGYPSQTDGFYRLAACVDQRAHIYDMIGIHTIYYFVLETKDSQRNYGIYANGFLVESSSQRVLAQPIQNIVPQPDVPTSEIHQELQTIVEESVHSSELPVEVPSNELPVEAQPVEESVVEQPVVEETVVEETVVEETVVEETVVEVPPVVEETVVEESAVEETVVEVPPVVEETVVEESAVEVPPVEETVVEESAVEVPPVEETVVEETVPSSELPVDEQPVVEETVVEESVVEDVKPVIEAISSNEGESTIEHLSNSGFHSKLQNTMDDMFFNELETAVTSSSIVQNEFKPVVSSSPIEDFFN